MLSYSCRNTFFNELNVKEHTKILAEREGFEPSIVLLLYTLFKRAEKTNCSVSKKN